MKKTTGRAAMDVAINKPTLLLLSEREAVPIIPDNVKKMEKQKTKSETFRRIDSPPPIYPWGHRIDK
jgi:hypothetical protein